VPEDDEAFAEEATDYLQKKATWLRQQGVEADSQVLFGWPAKRIIEVARDSAGLIAMTTHGGGGIDRLIVGSVADQVVRKADVPVLLFRDSQRNPQT
jgi:nucleotide-binding universal stress UspA family protein